MSDYAANAGQGKTHPDAACAYDAEHGNYEETVKPSEDNLPTKAMPKAADPNPFSVGK